MSAAAAALLVLAAIPTGTPVGSARDRLAVGAAVASQPADRAAVERAIRDSIGWALTEDRVLLESRRDRDGSLSTSDSGWGRFVANLGRWFVPRFAATRLQARDVRISFSQDGEVAWFSTVLGHTCTRDGTPGRETDTRWTGVLERRDGRWVIVQMHFSYAANPPTPDAPSTSPTGG